MFKYLKQIYNILRNNQQSVNNIIYISSASIKISSIRVELHFYDTYKYKKNI